MQKTIGERIRNRRKELHITQESLAEKSSVSRGTINALENGKCNNVTVGTLTAIASALDTTAEFFLT